MKKLAARLKMKQEGLRREAVYKNGTYLNVLEFGVLRSEYYLK
jgi:[ribosomal protein S5]-alanine N-acetyltransferase